MLQSKRGTQETHKTENTTTKVEKHRKNKTYKRSPMEGPDSIRSKDQMRRDPKLDIRDPKFKTNNLKSKNKSESQINKKSIRNGEKIKDQGIVFKI